MLSGSPAFEILPSEYNERYQVIVRYAGRDLLQSGWLIGEETLAKKAGMIAAPPRPDPRRLQAAVQCFDTMNGQTPHGLP